MTDPLPSDLQPVRIAEQLPTARYGRSLEVHAAMESTMDGARGAADRGAPDGHCVIADRQHRGRGAHGRHWSSPAGTDLYLSIVARPRLRLADRPLMTLAVGLAVAETAEAQTATWAQVKWPNDVWLRRRKCAGVLVETATTGDRAEAVIVGVGLDVNRRHWSDVPHGEAISLAEACGQELDRTRTLATLLGCIERWMDRLVTEGPAPVLDALNRRLALRGETVQCDGVTGVLEGVAPSGAIRMRTDAGIQERVSGRLRPV
jgi:BirA family biotin operon repressor/biotin-[acetyl-CoA-carboxylase] ligase